jgi:hypothetical protein
MKKKRVFSWTTVLILMAMTLLTESCSREDFCSGGYNTYDALVLDSGEPGADGCGWLIQVNDSLFHPVNLAEQFKVDLLTVTVAYENSGEIHQCGEYGGSFPSVNILCIKKQNIKNEVCILPENQWDQVNMDMYKIHTASVDGDSLRFFVSFGGGCRVHQFKLWKLPQIAEELTKVELFLAHDANGDHCQALLWENLAFSLKPLRIRGKNQVTFFLRGSPEMSAYFGEYVYKY